MLLFFLGLFWGVSVEEVVGFERDHRVREGEQVGSACQPNFVHYCALAASPLLSCNVYAPVFRKKKLCILHMCTYTGGPQKKLLEPWCPCSFASSQHPVLPDLEENNPKNFCFGCFLVRISRMKSNVHAEIWPHSTQFWLELSAPAAFSKLLFLDTLYTHLCMFTLCICA